MDSNEIFKVISGLDASILVVAIALMSHYNTRLNSLSKKLHEHLETHYKYIQKDQLKEKLADVINPIKLQIEEIKEMLGRLIVYRIKEH